MDDHDQFNGATTVARMAAIGVLIGIAEAEMYRRAGLIKGPWESFAPLVGFLCLTALAIARGDAPRSAS